MRPISIFILLLLGISSSYAQERGVFGVTAELSTGIVVSRIGVIYHPVEKIALRPYVSLSSSTSESESRYDMSQYFTRVTDNEFRWMAGLKAQYYVGSWEGVAGYIGAGGSHSASKREENLRIFSIDGDSITTSAYTTQRTTLEAFFGVQYNFARWFAVHVDLGANYYFGSLEDKDRPERNQETNGFSTLNSGLGAILYF